MHDVNAERAAARARDGDSSSGYGTMRATAPVLGASLLDDADDGACRVIVLASASLAPGDRYCVHIYNIHKDGDPIRDSGIPGRALALALTQHLGWAV